MMKRFYTLLALVCALVAVPRAHAGACSTLGANPSQAAVQSALNSCGDGNYVQLSAGLTSVSSSINIPCGVQIFGPTVAPFALPTAKFTATAMFLHIFTLNGSCASSNATGVSYVDMNYGAGVYVDQNNHSNIVINHNAFTNIADTFTQGSQAVDVALGNGNTINGFTFNYNTVGDANSCTVSVTNEVTGGTKTGIDSCGLQIFNQNSQISHMVNMTIKYNHFAQSSEAIHFYGANYVPSPPNQTDTCDNCDIEFNFFENVHVISIEFQGQTVNHPLIISNNVFAYPLYGENNTWFISDPCCQFGYTSGSSTINPAFITQNNIFLAIPKTGPINEGPCTAGSSGSTRYANAPCYGAEWGYEYWGNGSLAQHNLFQGFLCVAATVGYAGAAVPVINYNTMQGGQMSGTANGCVYEGGSGAYLTPEFNDTNLAQSVHTPNSQSATPVSVVSVAPSISPASGAYSSPPTVTLTDPGYTSSTSYVPLGNTSIWYTTDGSTPVPGASSTLLYTAPFAITLPVTVKAVGMWGVAPQPTSYPGGYGFTPSAVQSASYTSTGGITLSSVALSNVGAVHSLINGSSIQMNAICTYSDGSTTNCNTPDSYGNGVSSWLSSTPAVAAITPAGLVTAAATGSTNVTATVSGLPTPAWAMAVTPAMATLTAVSLATSGGISSLPVGGVNQLLATCTYSDNSTTNCGTTDSHGSAVGQWTSTAPTVATVSASGVVTAVGPGGTSLSAAVQYGAAQSNWGQTAEDVTGFTTAGYINSTYFVFGNQMGGYSGAGATCSFFLPTGTLVNGARFDCGLIPAPTPTTQATSWLCLWDVYGERNNGTECICHRDDDWLPDHCSRYSRMGCGFDQFCGSPQCGLLRLRGAPVQRRRAYVGQWHLSLPLHRQPLWDVLGHADGHDWRQQHPGVAVCHHGPAVAHLQHCGADGDCRPTGVGECSVGGHGQPLNADHGIDPAIRRPV